ncbi:hypothetical protein GE061_004935 [Apolygus lucorum]|uniref:Uncharacterized protein n=1 Tax=Apolygus lucorum TaxID=248454 RepID=A0A6A4IRK1_APOLU|nr:hypothetical protein GE061_004935 [Apolygus lucorum]
MANPSEFAREAFMNNILLVKALILLKPPQERDRATQWADLLSSHSNTAEEQSTKNEYLWYLLLVLQHGTLDSPPFSKAPGAGALKPLSTILDKETYQQVLKGTKNEIYFHDTLKELHRRRVNRDDRKRTDDEYDYLEQHEWTKEEVQSCRPKVEDWDTAPAQFLSNQPRPHQGAFCYASVFSDYGEDAN